MFLPSFVFYLYSTFYDFFSFNLCFQFNKNIYFLETYHKNKFYIKYKMSIWIKICDSFECKDKHKITLELITFTNT